MRTYERRWKRGGASKTREEMRRECGVLRERKAVGMEDDKWEMEMNEKAMERGGCTKDKRNAQEL